MSISTPALTNFTAGEVSPRLFGRVDLSKYFNGCKSLENFLVHPHGGATRRSGLRFVAEAASQDRAPLLVPFEFNAEQTYVLEMTEDETGQGIIRVFKDRGQVLSEGTAVEIASSYSGDDLARLRWVQSGDTLILVHPDHPPRTLTRRDHHDWELADIEFVDPPEAWGAGNYPSVACFYEERLVLAATMQQPGTLWFSRTGEYWDFRTRTREVPLADWGDVLIQDPNNGTRDGKSGDTFLLLDGESFEVEGVVKGTAEDGSKRYYRYLGSRVYLASGEDLTITFADSPGLNQIESVHDGSGNLTASWEEFTLGQRIDAPDGEDALDDDAIEITLSASQATTIEFLAPKSRLWVGTMGGEWTVGAASAGEPLTPKNARAHQEGTAGAARAMPASVGFASLFIQRAGRKLREMAYRFDSDAVASTDLTLLAEHVTNGGISQIAYAQEPDSIVYCLRADGAVLALTYHPEQDVLAWSRLTTRGEVEAITTIFDPTIRRDQLWAVVRRDVAGQSRRFVEYLEQVFEPDPELEAVADAYFLDCGLSYSGDPVAGLAGLDHLAGEEVTVLADGLSIVGVAVSAQGEIELERPASTVHVGLPYTSTLKPLALEGGSSRGTAQTKIKRITEVSVRFFNTLGGLVGPDEEHLEPVAYLTASAPLGRALPLFSGDKRVPFPKGWGREGDLCIRQSQPYPMSVLMVVPEMVVNT